MQWLKLQQENPEDYVISTGRTEIVSTFVELAAKKLGWIKNNDDSLGIIWEGEGINEVGKRVDTNEIVVRIDPRYFRPTEVDLLLGDSMKAKSKLGWTPKLTLDEIVEEMIINDLEIAQKELLLKKEGFKTIDSIDSY